MNAKKNALLIAVNNLKFAAISKVYIDYNSNDYLDTMYKLIDCSTITSAPCYGSRKMLENHITMIGDDEALFVNKPTLNTIASLIGGYLEHKQPLFGNFLVVKYTEDGENADLTDSDMNMVMREIEALVSQVQN